MLILWTIIFLITIIDQILKYLARVYIPVGSLLDTFMPFLKVANIKNTGAAFGSMVGMRIYLIISSIVIMGLVCYYIFKRKIKNLFVLISLAFVLGGGLSNLYDRVFFGFVTDYIKLSFFPPVCNLSDYCICCGTIAILIFMLRNNLKIK